MPVASSVIRILRPTYRWLRGHYLKLRYPRGRFLECNGVRVFCEFQDNTYSWYDADSPNLAFDIDVIKALLPQCQGDVFMDVGAHCGFFSSLLAQSVDVSGKPFQLVALEPDERHFRCLSETMRPFGSKGIHLFRRAIARSDGQIDLFSDPGAPCLHTYTDGKGARSGSVEGITLDTLWDTLFPGEARLAFLKIDIDGAEPELFAGGKKTIFKQKPVILMEFAPSCLRSAGVDLQQFYNSLCDDFMVYWVSYDRLSVGRVGRSDFPRIVSEVGDRITDFVLSFRSLEFPGALTNTK